MANYLKDCLKKEYQPINLGKYLGTKRLICKSSWEYYLFTFFDTNENIKNWLYEEIKISYFNPVKNCYSVYFPDFFINVNDVNSSARQYLIEVKPEKFLHKPILGAPPKTKNANTMRKYEQTIRRYNTESLAYAQNSQKWSAARLWCAQHNITFLLISEKNVPSFVQ